MTPLVVQDDTFEQDDTLRALVMLSEELRNEASFWTRGVRY